MPRSAVKLWRHVRFLHPHRLGEPYREVTPVHERAFVHIDQGRVHPVADKVQAGVKACRAPRQARRAELPQANQYLGRNAVPNLEGPAVGGVDGGVPGLGRVRLGHAVGAVLGASGQGEGEQDGQRGQGRGLGPSPHGLRPSLLLRVALCLRSVHLGHPPREDVGHGPGGQRRPRHPARGAHFDGREVRDASTRDGRLPGSGRASGGGGGDPAEPLRHPGGAGRLPRRRDSDSCGEPGTGFPAPRTTAGRSTRARPDRPRTSA